MSRILLADDSPHAQRMGERILRDEGYEVVTVTDGETALIRLPDVDPDVVMADVFLPRKSGYEICWHVKNHPNHRHARVVLLAGLLEPVNEAEAERVHADAILKKPFEASMVVATIRPLAEAAAAARDGVAEVEPPPVEEPAPQAGEEAEVEAKVEVEESPEPLEPPVPELIEEPEPPAPEPAAEAEVESNVEVEESPEPLEPPAPEPIEEPEPPAPEPVAEAEPAPAVAPEIDPELLRAAVTIALDQAMPAMIDLITERVLATLRR
jgi:CheY-like chemotaxis protein